MTINSDSIEVDLSNKEITDEEFMEIQPFFKIESLMLDNNKLTNAGVSVIMQSLKNMKKLLLNFNNFDAGALTGIANLTNLRVFQVNSNQLGDGCM